MCLYLLNIIFKFFILIKNTYNSYYDSLKAYVFEGKCVYFAIYHKEVQYYNIIYDYRSPLYVLYFLFFDKSKLVKAEEYIEDENDAILVCEYVKNKEFVNVIGDIENQIEINPVFAEFNLTEISNEYMHFGYNKKIDAITYSKILYLYKHNDKYAKKPSELRIMLYDNLIEQVLKENDYINIK